MRRPCCWPGCKHRERTGRKMAPGCHRASGVSGSHGVSDQPEGGSHELCPLSFVDPAVPSSSEV
jgi:hypothetical protein